MLRVVTSAGVAYHADLTELIQDKLPVPDGVSYTQLDHLEDTLDYLGKIVERLIEGRPAEERKRILQDILPDPHPDLPKAAKVRRTDFQETTP